MAQHALGSGNVAKRRVLFGLLERDGWAWAFLKALGWFVAIILLMGYLPDRAYYFTVFSTIDAIEEHVTGADLVIGGVLLPGAAAPKLTQSLAEALASV